MSRQAENEDLMRRAFLVMNHMTDHINHDDVEGALVALAMALDDAHKNGAREARESFWRSQSSKRKGKLK